MASGCKNVFLSWIFMTNAPWIRVKESFEKPKDTASGILLYQYGYFGQISSKVMRGCKPVEI